MRAYVIYSLPTVRTMMIFAPAGGILQGIYVRDFGLSLASIGVVIFAVRIFDALTDPLIGALSDRYRHRHGHRRPWIWGGSIMLAVTGYLLYVPLLTGSIVYFATVYSAFYLAWTILEIPHVAWGSEITSSARERSILYSVRAMAYQVGALLGYAFPLLPFFVVHQYTPETLQWFALLAAAYLVPAAFLSARFTPAGPAPATISRALSWSDAWMLVAANRPLLVFLAAMVMAGLGLGMWAGIWFVAVDSYFRLGNQAPLLFTLMVPAGMVGIPVWGWIAARISKRIAWSLSMSLGGVCLLGLAAVPPDGGGFPLLAVLTVLLGAVISGQGVLVPSILGDISDFAQWKFRRDVRAVYFSLYTMSVKILVGFGSAVAFIILGLFDYDVTVSTHDGSALLGMVLTLAVLPALCLLLSTLLIWLYPLDERRHAIIVARLAARQSR